MSANSLIIDTTDSNDITNTKSKMSSATATDETNNPPTTGVDTSASNRNGPSDAANDEDVGDPKSAQQPTQKQQGADRPSEEPASDSTDPKMPHSDAEREELMKKGEFPHDPNDHSGEPMKMHDSTPNAEKKERSESVAQEGGNPHGKEMGTGTQIVKATGLQADGGDFDASKPGAGSEANRKSWSDL
jgi:hypothetical protein